MSKRERVPECVERWRGLPASVRDYAGKLIAYTATPEGLIARDCLEYLATAAPAPSEVRLHDWRWLALEAWRWITYARIQLGPSRFDLDDTGHLVDKPVTPAPIVFDASVPEFTAQWEPPAQAVHVRAEPEPPGCPTPGACAAVAAGWSLASEPIATEAQNDRWEALTVRLERLAAEVGATETAPCATAEVREAVRELMEKVDRSEHEYHSRMHQVEDGSPEYHQLWHAWVAYDCVRHWLKLLRTARLRDEAEVRAEALKPVREALLTAGHCGDGDVAAMVVRAIALAKHHSEQLLADAIQDTCAVVDAVAPESSGTLAERTTAALAKVRADERERCARFVRDNFVNESTAWADAITRGQRRAGG